MYIVKGIFKNQKCYYIDSSIDNSTGLMVRRFSAVLSGATKFEDEKDAKVQCNQLHDRAFRIVGYCPECFEEFDGHPALSRKDNKTEICPQCGMKEALNRFIKYKKEQN